SSRFAMSNVWKTHGLFRFTTGFHHALLFYVMYYYYTTEAPTSKQSVSEIYNKDPEQCLHDHSTMFLLTIFLLLAQAMSGYIEKCFSLFALFIVAHIGVAVGLFFQHVLFIYTHRGITFYQWIPLKIREFYQNLTAAKHPKGHLYQK
ncbi:hypothetical protein PENTCL1PPCAC_25450, partial [Pristionchus entomophagus]